MTSEEFKKLRRGDIIRNGSSGNTYVITATIGDGDFIAVNTIHVCNPCEWTPMEKLPSIEETTLKELEAAKININRAIAKIRS